MSDDLALQLGIVLATTEEVCTVALDDEPVDVGYAEVFPRPRGERVSPGHLVALDTSGGVSRVVWRWFDVVVLDPGDEGDRVWEPGHGAVLARRRPGVGQLVRGSRAYASAGLPGAAWWLAGPVVPRARDARVDVPEVVAFLREHGLLDIGSPPQAGDRRLQR